MNPLKQTKSVKESVMPSPLKVRPGSVRFSADDYADLTAGRKLES